MPAALYSLQPYVGADGGLIMYPEGGVPDMAEPSDGVPVPPVAGAAAEVGTTPPLARASAAPPEGLPNGAMRWVDGTPYRGCATIPELPPDTRVWFEHGVKKGVTKSALRYAAYQVAGTIAEAKARNPDKAKASADLKYDLVHGHCWLLPPTGVYYADWIASTNIGRVYAARHGPIPGIECPEALRAYPGEPSPARPPCGDGPEPWMLRERAMWHGGEDDHVDVELRRIMALEEGPPLLSADSPPSVRAEAKHFAEYDHGRATDGRRLSQRYADGERAARNAVLDDERARGATEAAFVDE